MNTKHLQIGKVRGWILLLFVLPLMAHGQSSNFDFSAVCTTGQTLYYQIADYENHYVWLVYPEEPIWAPGFPLSYTWYSHSKPVGEIEIPEHVEYEGELYSITAIGSGAFCDCDELTGQLIIPNSVEWIGEQAFAGCSGLTGSLVIPNTVESIGESAFAGCYGFDGSLTLSNQLMSLENHVFEGCYGFTGSLVIPNTVERIGESAFRECYGFNETLTLPEFSLIDDYAFSDCYGFTGLTNTRVDAQIIGDYAFSGCWNLTFSLQELLSPIGIGKYAFSGCRFTGQTSIYGGNIGERAFSNCGFEGSLSLIWLDSISDYAFEYSGINGSLTLYGSDAFYGMEENRTYIGNHAFEYCLFSGNLTIPNSVIFIGDNAFENCLNMTSLTIGESINSIGDSAFSGCDMLSSVLMKCSTPPTITEYTFPESLVESGLIAVPCGATSAYESADYWSGFNNYQEATTDFRISLTTEYDENEFETDYGQARIVSYPACENVDEGESGVVTVSAIPNEGYTFLFWVKDGEVVSRDALYTFSLPQDYGVSNDYFLVAVFRTLNEHSDFSQTLPSGLTLFYKIQEDNPDCVTLVGYTSNNNSLVDFYIPVYPKYEKYQAFYHLTKIGYGAFYHCNYISSVTFSGGHEINSIGELAFAWCENLKNIKFLSNGFFSIGQDAFANCVNLESMTIKYHIPLDIEVGDAFYNVPKDIPVYIPCGSTSAYQSASGWDEFTNYREPYDYILSVTSSDAEMGQAIVSQQPDCSNEGIAIVSAIANSGYEFLNWTENGEVVSTDVTYSFTATADRDLVANFGTLTLHWTYDISQFEDYMSVRGVVQIDGIEQRRTDLEIGAFCGDECRGAKFAAYFPPTDRYIYQLPIYGNNGDVISFKLYDHQLGEELVLLPPANVDYQLDGYGTLSNPYVFNFILTVEVAATANPAEAGTISGTGNYAIGSTATLTATANENYVFDRWTENGQAVSTDESYSFDVTEARTLTAEFNYVQTISLPNGWNWGSTNVELSNIDGLSILEQSLGDNGEMIRTRNGMSVDYYEGYGWWGDLTSINNEEMYEVRTKADCNASIEGQLCDPANHPITINPGWNWIGCPIQNDVALSTGLSDLSCYNDDVIKSHFSFSSYFEGFGWYGDVETLNPGAGYKFFSNGSDPQTFVYQTGNRNQTTMHTAIKERHFKADAARHKDNMSVIAVTLLDGVELKSSDYELAAFVNGECRGSVRLLDVEPLNRHLAFLTVLGTNDDEISYRLYDVATGISYKSDPSQNAVFSTDAIIGTQLIPNEIRFSSDNSDNVAIRELNLYPNPINRNKTFTVEIPIAESEEGVIEVCNALGEKIISTNVAQSCTELKGVSVAGIYQIKAVVGSHVYCGKIVVK